MASFIVLIFISTSEYFDYNDQEKAFIQRMKEREEELLKQNFEVPEGLRVNMGNLLNPMQIKDIDPKLSQQLGQDGFAIVPARHNQLFEVYEQNDYQEFPSFVTTDLFLQLYHLYFDCMLRELEEAHLLKLVTDFSHDMFYAMHRQLNWSGFDETVEKAALKNCIYYSVAHYLFTGEFLGTPEVEKPARAEAELVMAGMDNYKIGRASCRERVFLTV